MTTTASTNEKKPRVPLVVEFGEGRLGLELIPCSVNDASVGSVVNSVSGPAETAKIQIGMKLLKVNEIKVEAMAFADLMALLQHSKRPIKMYFL